MGDMWGGAGKKQKRPYWGYVFTYPF